MPMAFYGKGVKYDNILTTPGFVSAYVNDADNPQYDGKIILVYEDDVKVYEVPKHLVNDYWKIICSQYQEVSRSYLEYVVTFWKGTYKPPNGPEEYFNPFEEIHNMGVL